MSVLIQGMNMPKDVTLLAISPDGTVDIVSGQPDLSWKTLKDKSISIPPHGRLGDLDAIAQQIEHERFHHPHTDGLAARHHVAEYGHFLKVISDAPTIIPADKEGE